MKKMSFFIAATFAAGLFLSGMAVAQSGSGMGASGSAGQSQRSQSDMQSGQSGMQDSQSGMQSSQQSGKQQLSSEQVRQLQQQLQAQGHDPGGVDGKMGPKTSKALREFQEAQGISASGQPDTQTLQALGIQGQQGQEEFMGVSPGFESEQQKEKQRGKEMDKEMESKPAPGSGTNGTGTGTGNGTGGTGGGR